MSVPSWTMQEQGPAENVEALLYARAEMIISAYKLFAALESPSKFPAVSVITDQEIDSVLQVTYTMVVGDANSDAEGAVRYDFDLAGEITEARWTLSHPVLLRRYQLTRNQFERIVSLLEGDQPTYRVPLADPLTAG